MKQEENWGAWGGDARLSPRFRTIAELDAMRRKRNRKLWLWGTCIVAAYVAYCLICAH